MSETLIPILHIFQTGGNYRQVYSAHEGKPEIIILECPKFAKELYTWILHRSAIWAH